MPPPDPEIYALAELVGKKLRAQRKTIAVAESCTGGLLGAAFTDVPGSSKYFIGGIIAYADALKVNLLGVSQVVLDAEGAVSAMTAAAMAGGVRNLLNADIGLSITGVAGPAEEEHKRAGLTYIGIANPMQRSVQYRWSGDRWFNRRQSVLAALQLLAPELEVVHVS
jgi:PncC family amidohydrolase